MSHAPNIDEFKSAISEIAAPGLNVVYADTSGNIGWYAAAKLVKRKRGHNSKIILDGSGIDDWIGYYDFSENPQIENPSRGVVLSANNPPLSDSVHLFPGYYLPPDRFNRINQFFHSRRMLDLSYMKQIATDATNGAAAGLAHIMLDKLPGVGKLRSQIHARCADTLDQWKGNHGLNDVAPVIYYKWMHHLLHEAFADELGEKDFQAFLKTHVQKNAMKDFLLNDSSVWWDNVNSKYRKEKAEEIVERSFNKTVLELIQQFGPDPEKWTWRKVHTLEISHLLGRKKPLNKIFNIGPLPVEGGLETLNNQSFDLTGEGLYRVNLAPAMRRSIDFADVENAFNVSPSGQSGNFMSRFYRDQFRMYVHKNDREEMMNRNEILKTYHARTTFIPQR
jgi:penicillin amidase